MKRTHVPSADPGRARRSRVPQDHLARTRAATIATRGKTVRQSRDVATFMAPLVAGLDRETVWVVLLDAKHRVIGVHLVRVGSPAAAVVRPRELAKTLILAHSAGAILVHQHPRGTSEPSTEDLALGDRFRAVGDLLGIRILDHVVLGQDGAYCSLADHGQRRASWRSRSSSRAAGPRRPSRGHGGSAPKTARWGSDTSKG